MLTGLRHCQDSPTTPLAVTGHICSLGTEATNLRLSRLRAEQVATLLRDRGYTLVTVSGKGATDPVSSRQMVQAFIGSPLTPFFPGGGHDCGRFREFFSMPSLCPDSVTAKKRSFFFLSLRFVRDRRAPDFL